MGRKKKQIHEYESRLEVFEGKMGAGKSYFAVRRMFNILEEQARPVYTNLPVKWRVVRKYLRDRHGEEMANLVHELTEDHWRSFLRRQDKFAKFKARADRIDPRKMTDEEIQIIYEACQEHYFENPPSFEKLKRQDHFFINQILAWFDATHEPPIDHGPDANHIPPSAIIIIDEVQKWHPMMKQSHDKDREFLLSYITMSRHHAHWIWVLTQDAMNISIEFRRLAHNIWSIWNRYEDQIAGPVRFKHFGLRAMGYARMTPEEYEQQKSMHGVGKQKRSLEFFTVITNLPGSKLFYRFYSSETHLGSRRQLAKKLEEGRRRAGISETGINLHQEDQEMKKSSIFSKAYLLLALLVVTAGAFIVGKQSAEPTQQQTEIVEDVQSVEWPEWTMVSSEPWIAGRPLRVGETIQGTRSELLFVSDDYRSLVFNVNDDYWLWEFGSEPFRVGSTTDVRTAVTALLDEQRNGSGQSISPLGTEYRERLGTEPGDS